MKWETLRRNHGWIDTQHVAILVDNNEIAFARHAFETLTVDDRDRSVMVADYTGLLKYAGCNAGYLRTSIPLPHPASGFD